MKNTQKAFYCVEEINKELPPQIKDQINLIGWYICNPDEINNLIDLYGGFGYIQWRDERNKLHTKLV